MTEIKSALELALERTQNIEGNKEILVANERKNDGKRLASRFLQPGDESVDVSGELKKLNKDDAKLVREGFFETMLANLTLPNDGEYKTRLKLIEDGVHLVSKERRQISYLFQQVDQFYEQFLQTKEQISEQLKRNTSQNSGKKSSFSHNRPDRTSSSRPNRIRNS